MSTIKKIITIEVYGEEEDDLNFALEEALKRIKTECTSGFGSNAYGGFSFTVMKAKS